MPVAAGAALLWPRVAEFLVMSADLTAPLVGRLMRFRWAFI